ncbi:hypothetical protein BBD42_09125 [Paenibacillus sp. BIHB 4019]|uniref:DUF4870 domain-containing protein n=1 Tax=Paenibacillus sp. BIHB 4019 TaxID=1870819 RepID=A0A1B2DFV9_9BACL|nr:DUF4870 domain-containing protein [Paenibacillus sp. BIHB 4019]ANY66600.1 hypothetical protein BBD42_09125 [Paenibacillus sp. BIHB 4019]
MQQFNQPDQSSTGLDPKVAALLCYVLGFISGIIFLVLEKNSRYVKFHAMQSIITFAGLGVVSLVINIIPIIGTLISALISILTFVLWIVLMLQAYQGKQFKLPYVGDIAEKQAAQFK